MLAWLLDQEKFIKVNMLQEVTDPIMFDKGRVPSTGGLFSTEIFGTSTNDRKNTFAYIDLKTKFILPKAYITLKRLNRNFECIVYGTKSYAIQNGALVEDENGGTGIKWLYDNWEKIKFEKNDSSQRNERVDVLTINKKDTIFCDKYIVLPAFYRDVNLQDSSGKIKVGEINDCYAKILRNVRMIGDNTNFDFMIHTLVGKTQDTLVELYDIIKDKLAGKNGYIRKFLMGKNIDLGSRVVITGIPYDTNSPDDMKVDFYHTGIPLSHACSMFTPFIVWWVKRFMKTRFENHKNSFPVTMKDGSQTTVRLEDPEMYFNDEYIKARIDKFKSTPSTRFDPIEVPVKEEDLKRVNMPRILAAMTGYYTSTTTMEKTDDKLTRPLTWTDVFYMAAEEVTRDKHVYVTRFPVLDYFGTYPSRITVLSTQETKPMIINDVMYKFYPVINLKTESEDIAALFKDTANLPVQVLNMMGADHDGDQVSVKGVFSQEANEEAERIMTSKANILNIQGEIARQSASNEGLQTLYSMTMFKD